MSKLFEKIRVLRLYALDLWMEADSKQVYIVDGGRVTAYSSRFVL
jgi:hypothetical protein